MFKNQFIIAKEENVKPFFQFNFMEAQKVYNKFSIAFQLYFLRETALLVMIIEKFLT